MHKETVSRQGLGQFEEPGASLLRARSSLIDEFYNGIASE